LIKSLGRRSYSQYVSELWPTFQGATVQKIFLVGIAAAGLLSGSALASDLPVKAPVYTAPIAPPPYNWSGLYVGANFGGGWSNGSLNIPGNNLYGGLSEFIGGVQAGYRAGRGNLDRTISGVSA
jgi:opacity protein-like surface antigen